jgi:hypothetical protein
VGGARVGEFENLADRQVKVLSHTVEPSPSAVVPKEEAWTAKRIAVHGASTANGRSSSSTGTGKKMNGAGETDLFTREATPLAMIGWGVAQPDATA